MFSPAVVVGSIQSAAFPLVGSVLRGRGSHTQLAHSDDDETSANIEAERVARAHPSRQTPIAPQRVAFGLWFAGAQAQWQPVRVDWPRALSLDSLVRLPARALFKRVQKRASCARLLLALLFDFFVRLSCLLGSFILFRACVVLKESSPWPARACCSQGCSGKKCHHIVAAAN